MPAIGSSPPAWGTCWDRVLPESPPAGEHGTERQRQRVYRFIPTCVGNIPNPGTLPLASSVHPHLRGEHHCVVTSPPYWGGSSPPAWGTCSNLPEKTVVRFIPTCVGNIRYQAKVWGLGGQSRFIPTCVGNIQRYAAEERAGHPHLEDRPRSGSSPPAWGTSVIHYPTCVISCFREVSGSSPPAWGTSIVKPGFTVIQPVHPHLRGEHAHHRVLVSLHMVDERFIPTCVGNIAISDNFAILVTRFIPTCVGNMRAGTRRLSRPRSNGSSPPAWGTFVCFFRSRPMPVHPHLRGEHISIASRV